MSRALAYLRQAEAEEWEPTVPAPDPWDRWEPTPLSEAVAVGGSPLDMAVAALRAYGVELPATWPSDPGLLVLLAEAVNAAAKNLEMGFYDLKPQVVDEVASLPGVRSGWGEDGAFYLAHPSAGVVSFHDPRGEIQSGGRWRHPWSCIERQPWALQCLTDEALRARLARLTWPEAGRRGAPAGVTSALPSRGAWDTRTWYERAQARGRDRREQPRSRTGRGSTNTRH